VTRRALVGLAACALAASTPALPAGEADPPAAGPPDPAALCAPGTVIGTIDVECVNVFDTSIPAENKGIYRAANWVHSINLTRESRVRSLLIVRPGDPCDLERLAEAERELRNLPFLSDAWVEPIAREANEVRVKVRVRDSWSTRIGISAGIAGGAERATFRIVERNLLGTGVGLGWRYQKNIDRTLRTFDLYAPSLTRQRWQLDALYSDNSDGYQRTLIVSRPFFSLDTPWSSLVSGDRRELEQKVYDFGEEIDLWRRNYEGAKALFGWARPRDPGGNVVRWYGGVRRLVETWERVDPAKPPTVAEIPPPDADAWLVEAGFEWIVPRFVKTTFLDSGRRVEDVDLSTRVLVTVDRSVASLSEERAFEFEAVASTGFALDEKNTLLLRASQLARMSGGDWYDVITSLNAEYYLKPAPLHTTFLALSAARGEDLPSTSQFLLGADTGLRGYAARQFDGDRMFLLQAEHRLFLSREWLRLVRLAFVGFVDVGLAWGSEERISWSDLRPDAGLGVRVSLLRGTKGAGLAAYAGYPLNRDGLPEDENGWQFTVFTFTGF
jgi:hypothetical protein